MHSILGDLHMNCTPFVSQSQTKLKQKQHVLIYFNYWPLHYLSFHGVTNSSLTEQTMHKIMTLIVKLGNVHREVQCHFILTSTRQCKHAWRRDAIMHLLVSFQI